MKLRVRFHTRFVNTVCCIQLQSHTFRQPCIIFLLVNFVQWLTNNFINPALYLTYRVIIDWSTNKQTRHHRIDLHKYYTLRVQKHVTTQTAFKQTYIHIQIKICPTWVQKHRWIITWSEKNTHLDELVKKSVYCNKIFSCSVYSSSHI